MENHFLLHFTVWDLRQHLRCYFHYKRNRVKIMKTYIYRGGFPIVEKSGVGKAIEHQEKMLNAVEAPRAARWKEATVVHMNTVFPDSVIAAFIAKMQKKKVIYYGHSTMEDFKNSFIGSNLAAPIFKKWICFCYNLGDVVVTPTEYSRKLLEGYGLKRKIYPITNGVDTEFFGQGQVYRLWCLRQHLPQAGDHDRRRRPPQARRYVLQQG